MVGIGADSQNITDHDDMLTDGGKAFCQYSFKTNN